MSRSGWGERFGNASGEGGRLVNGEAGRHLLRAVHHRLLRTRSFQVWDEVTCAC